MFRGTLAIFAFGSYFTEQSCFVSVLMKFAKTKKKCITFTFATLSGTSPYVLHGKNFNVALNVQTFQLHSYRHHEHEHRRMRFFCLFVVCFFLKKIKQVTR